MQPTLTSPKLSVVHEIRDVRWGSLYEGGVHWAVFDIENTLEPIAKRGQDKLFRPETIEFLVGMQRLGFGLCLATNSLGNFDYMLSQLRGHQVEASFIQPGPGKRPRKPQPAYFDRILEEILPDGRADQAVMIGDKLEFDVLPAIRAGMHGIWVKRLGHDVRFLGLPVEAPRRWREERVRRRIGCAKP